MRNIAATKYTLAEMPVSIKETQASYNYDLLFNSLYSDYSIVDDINVALSDLASLKAFRVEKWKDGLDRIEILPAATEPPIRDLVTFQNVEHVADHLKSTLRQGGTRLM